MTDEPEGPPRGPWLPEHLRGLTRDTATDEQRAEIRAAFRQRLNDMEAYWTPERRAERQARFAERLEGAVEEQRAAREADPVGFWRGRGEQEAREVLIREHYVPADMRDTYRAGFDEALREERSRSNPVE